jgi:hypothetical protein
VEAAGIPWRPLGRVLVEKGLLSDEALERALEEQAVTGRRLGEVLVELGCVSHSELSLALAEQYGFELTNETGFGPGLRPQLERPQDGARPTAQPVLALVPSPDPPDERGEESDPLHLAQLEEHWAKLAAAEARLAEVEHELALAQRLADRRRVQAVRLVRRLRARGAHAVDLSLPNGHVLLVQLADRYELFERDGGPPAQDAFVELPGIGDEAFIVDRLCRSPLPNDARLCVVLRPSR